VVGEEGKWLLREERGEGERRDGWELYSTLVQYNQSIIGLRYDEMIIIA
jgi:hypothetical protein